MGHSNAKIGKGKYGSVVESCGFGISLIQFCQDLKLVITYTFFQLLDTADNVNNIIRNSLYYILMKC